MIPNRIHMLCAFCLQTTRILLNIGICSETMTVLVEMSLMFDGGWLCYVANANCMPTLCSFIYLTISLAVISVELFLHF